MPRVEYDWALELRRSDGSRLTQVRIEPDWDPACEWMRFVAARRGALPIGAASPVSRAEPKWHATLGAPFTSGFRLRIPSPGHRALVDDFAISYFAGLAEQASAPLVKAGALKAGEQFVYFPIAYPRERAAAAPVATPGFVLREVDAMVPVSETDVGDLRDRSTPRGDGNRQDAAVFIPQPVIDEVTKLVRAEPEREVGGILIGHVHRDIGELTRRRRHRDLFLEVTAQISANARGDGTKLSFTSDTWTGVRAALDLRRQGEVMLGWWHSHVMSALCGNCPAERQRVCSLAGGFLSHDDRVLHRSIFPRAYGVALVMSLKTDGAVTSALFGWRRGLIARRGYHVLDANSAMGHYSAADAAGNESMTSHHQTADLCSQAATGRN